MAPSANADADVVVVGAGHNGLIAAGYLAAAGKRVLVLERNAYPGGGVASVQLDEPGYLSERHSLLHVRIMPNPLIAHDELGLQSRYGLDYIHLTTPHSALFEDGTFLPLSRDRAITLAHIEAISPRDAPAFDRFMDRAVAMVELLTPGLFRPPTAYPSYIANLDGTPLGREVLRSMNMSVADVLGEWFEDERVRILLSRLGSELTLAHPEDLNTGMTVYLIAGLTERYGMAVPRGGGSAFTQACVRCIEDHEGEVRTNVDVETVLAESGQAIGVRTGDGSVLRAADAVLAAIHPHRLGKMVEDIDPALAQRASQRRVSPFTAFVVHAALEEPLSFRGDAKANEIIWNTLSGTSLDAMNGAFDDLRRGRLPTVPLLEAGCPSAVDPSRAPEGRAVLHMLCITTRQLAQGGPEKWNAIKETFADSLIARLGEFTTNFGAGTLSARRLVTPLDHETASPSFLDGDYTGLASYSHQMGGLRPTPELSDYRVPGVGGLYLTGPFMHPGGGVVGGGRATAIAMFEDLGLDFGRFEATSALTGS